MKFEPRGYKVDRRETDALRALLDAREIKYETEDDGERRLMTSFVIGETRARVICDYYSCGMEEGLLEVWCINGSGMTRNVLNAKNVIGYVNRIDLKTMNNAKRAVIF